MVFAEEIQYVTRQELLTVAAIIISLSAVISGIIVSILKGTINMKTLSLLQAHEAKSEAMFDKNIDNVKEEMGEIKDNYLARFQRQYEMLASLRETIIEVKTEIKKDMEYIKKKLDAED